MAVIFRKLEHKSQLTGCIIIDIKSSNIGKRYKSRLQCTDSMVLYIIYIYLMPLMRQDQEKIPQTCSNYEHNILQGAVNYLPSQRPYSAIVMKKIHKIPDISIILQGGKFLNPHEFQFDAKLP